MKYDCNKTIDYVHEYMRMCDTENPTGNLLDCGMCPFNIIVCDSCDEVIDITQEMIDALQKWSDEHPEPLRLTKREYEFLTSFAPCIEGRAIERTAKGLYIAFRHAFNEETNSYYINPDLFPFISVGEKWDFNELLELEVIE